MPPACSAPGSIRAFVSAPRRAPARTGGSERRHIVRSLRSHHGGGVGPRAVGHQVAQRSRAPRLRLHLRTALPLLARPLLLNPVAPQRGAADRERLSGGRAAAAVPRDLPGAGATPNPKVADSNPAPTTIWEGWRWGRSLSPALRPASPQCPCENDVHFQRHKFFARRIAGSVHPRVPILESDVLALAPASEVNRKRWRSMPGWWGG